MGAVTERRPFPYHDQTMMQITSPPTDPSAPSGASSLPVRLRYLRRRSQRRRLGDRGMTALWLATGAMVSWLFAVGFATLGH